MRLQAYNQVSFDARGHSGTGFSPPCVEALERPIYWDLHPYQPWKTYSMFNTG